MLRIPRLSPEAASCVESIAGHGGDSIDLSALNQPQLEELLIVIEAENIDAP